MTALSVRNLNVWYGDKHTLNDVSVEIPLRRITCIIGPSGCGKSTLLKALNRLLDLNDQVKVSAGLSQTTTATVSRDWSATRLIAPKAQA